MLQKRAVTQAKATLLRVSPHTHTPINIAAKNVLLICGRINTGQSKRRQSCITGHLWMWSGTCKPAEAHMFISISLIFFLEVFFEIFEGGVAKPWNVTALEAPPLIKFHCSSRIKSGIRRTPPTPFGSPKTM